jgi:hypothetical protein
LSRVQPINLSVRYRAYSSSDAADEVLYGGANTVIPAKVAGSNAVNQFNYQLSLLLSKVP